MKGWIKLAVFVAAVTALNAISALTAKAVSVPFEQVGRLEAGDSTLNDGSLYDEYTFTGEAGQTVAITLESTEFDPYLTLRDAVGNEVASSDDIETESGNYNSFILLRLPADGVYQIWANSYSSTAQGSYRLTVRDGTLYPSPLLSEAAIAQVERNQLLELGTRQYRGGQLQGALQSWNEALALYQTSGDRRGEANTLGNLGLVYDAIGQYQRAIDAHQRSLAIERELGNRQGEAISLGSLGLVYGSIGQYRRAIDLHQQSLAIKRDIGDRQGEAASLGNLGIAYSSIGEYQRAIELHQQSLVINREVGDRSGEASALGNLGLAHDSLGQPQQAINFFLQSLDIAREGGDRQGQAASLSGLGNAYESLGQYQQAIEQHQQALDLDRAIGDRQGQAVSLNNLGLVYLNINQFASAAALLSESIETLEVLRRDLSDAQLIAIADTQSQAYTNLESALLAQNKIDEALVITERGRAQAFALQLAIYQNERSDLVTSYPSLEEIRRIAAQQNATLVEYAINSGHTLRIWVISPSGDIQFRAVDLVNADISANTLTDLNISRPRDGAVPTPDALIADLRSIAVVARQEQPEALRDLHKILIEPIADLLPPDPTDNVVFIPQGSLFLVPFPALRDETGTYLIEKHTISTAPSIQVLGLAGEMGNGLRRESSRTEVEDALIIGNPTMPTVAIADENGLEEIQLSPLPGAEREAKAIGDLLNSAPLIGNEATEAQVKAQLPDAGLIHLATHGLLEYGDPQALAVRDFPGAIALAPGDGEDGLLTASEILEMELQANLAVLSACDTGRGRITGDGVVGLSRALITAGVPSVVVSLWAVPDAPTADLMSEFYRQFSQGQTKAQALRQALLLTLEKNPNPRDWAAFTLIGAAE
ncbi:MAG: CHAT domain-containing protein [Cyanobacteria bacterium P01_D01_bin.128]